MDSSNIITLATVSSVLNFSSANSDTLEVCSMDYSNDMTLAKLFSDLTVSLQMQVLHMIVQWSLQV